MTHCHCCHCWSAPPTTSHCTHIHGLHQHSASVDECYWLQCFSHRGIQCHTFAWYALPCQMPLCQTAPLQPSVMQHQHVMEYWWEGSASTAIPPTSASEDIGWCYKTEGITFEAAFVHLKCLPRSQFEMAFQLTSTSVIQPCCLYTFHWPLVKSSRC